MIEIIPVQIYSKVFYWVMFVICLLTGIYYQDSKGCEKLLRQNSAIIPFLFSFLLIVYIGFRPISWAFGDMPLYNHKWNITEVDSIDLFFDYESEWFFEFLIRICKLLVQDSQFWFFVVELFYIGCQFWACKKLLWENVWLAIMFVFFSYQFFTFGTNGLRNGMGTAIMMLSLSFFAERSKIGFTIGVLLFIIAMGCHRSVIIPMAALMVSLFVIKKVKSALYIWIGCIILSLFFGGFFQGLFASLGFDSRMSDYSNSSEVIMNQFSHVGFRWDFLLYSSMPVLLAWYVQRLGVSDKTFTLLANTYIIANSFWILVCRVAYSNRFAYLSWFMYALVIAYAVIRLPIWKNQDKKTGQILIVHSLFTIFMYIIGR